MALTIVLKLEIFLCEPIGILVGGITGFFFEHLRSINTEKIEANSQRMELKKKEFKQLELIEDSENEMEEDEL